MRSDVSVQPRIATCPSRASMPTAIRSAPTAATAAGTIAGSIAAAVPMTTRATPCSSPSRTSSTVRSPPPSCTRTRPPTRATIRRTSARFSPSPNARSRSTTWIHAAPSSAKRSRHRHGILPINGLPRRLALAQANDAAMSDVDGGKEVHYGSATGATGPGFRRPAGRWRGAAALRLVQQQEQPVALAARSRRGAASRIGAPLPSSTRRESLATPFTRNS